MKQLLILSGKGGTGKTTFATAFIQLSQAKAYADCDVDAPNLHLLLTKEEPDEVNDFYGLPKAIIDYDQCINCGKCMDYCRFNAISYDGSQYTINPYNCEGCGVCSVVCQVGAISMENAVAGDLMLYKDEHLFSTAKLRMGSGTSGKLVSEVKKQLKAASEFADVAIIDGSPGIGCPVIASLSGADLVLIVAEPTISGISDMKRIVETAGYFKMKAAVSVNKYDVNEEKTTEIMTYCKGNKLPFVGKVPYDKKVVMALNNGESVMSTDSQAKEAIEEVYNNTMSILL